MPLAEAEQAGVKFAALLDTNAPPSLAALRAMPAERLLEATAKPGAPWPTPSVDGYLFPKPPPDIFAAGEQARVPLLAGFNSEESGYGAVLGRQSPTVENYRNALKRLYGDKADGIFKLYPASGETEVMDAAQDLAGDRFISFSTWKWVDLATKTGGRPTWLYLYSRPRPPMRAEPGKNPSPSSRGAVHSAEIEYAMGNLDSNKVYAWTPDDYKVSNTMQQYFANFIKTGNPNGPGLPNWPTFANGQRLVIDVTTRAEPDKFRARYEFLDQLPAKR
jgi:para-nitrobenzyl esterase